MEEKTIVVCGWLYEIKHCESANGVYVNSGDGGLLISEELAELSGHFVSIRYYISDAAISEDELIKDNILTLIGSLHAEHSTSYSEYTGYLWTDDIVDIGDHSLLTTLSNHLGKYLWLEAKIHK